MLGEGSELPVEQPRKKHHHPSLGDMPAGIKVRWLGRIVARLGPLVKAAAALSGLAVVTIGGVYLNLAKPHQEFFRKKARSFRQGRRALPKLMRPKQEDQYVQFQALPLPTLQSKRAFRELRLALVKEKRIPANLDTLAESLTSYQSEELSYQISPDVALRLAFAVTEFGSRRIAELIYKGRPVTCLADKLPRKPLPTTKAECIHFIEGGNLERLFQCNAKTDRLHLLMALTYFVQDRAIFYHTGWIRHLAEYASSPPELIQQAVEALACLENLRCGSGQFSDRLVLPLYLPPENVPITVDLIFIHGVWGSCYHTWRQALSPEPQVIGTNNSLVARIARRIASSEDKASQRCSCWPRYWLPRDLIAGARVLAVNYSSDRVERLLDLVSSVRSKLLDCGVGKRPIIWVAHSMGGLLAKNLSMATEFRDCTSGFVFYSVPHHGCGLISENVARLAPMLHQLSLRNQDELESLHRRWLEAVQAVPVLSLVEKLPLRIPPSSMAVVIVDRDTANPGIGDLFTIGQKDHVSVCKPHSRAAADYQIVVGFLNSLVTTILEKQRPCVLPSWAVGEQCPLGPEYIIADDNRHDREATGESATVFTTLPSFTNSSPL